MTAPPYPHVLLLGGAPQSGKSTLARRLAARLDYALVSTDDLGAAVRALVDPIANPALHPARGVDYREYYVERTIDVLWAEALAAHRALWPAVRAVIEEHAGWGAPAVVEGWALLPELVAELDTARVGAVWLVASEALLARRVRADAGFHAGASDPAAMMARFVGRSAAYNDHVRAGGRCVEVADDEPVEALVDRVLGAL